MLYNQPKYYELAFSFIDVKKQTSFFEKLFKKYIKVKVKSVLDVACGPSLQLREFARQSYECFGLDLNKNMLIYLKEEAQKEQLNIQTIHANMCNFKLPHIVDFAFIMMGSLGYLKNNEEFIQHLDTIAKTLNKGGLYFIENYRLDWNPQVLFKKAQWTEEKEEIKVTTTYQMSIKSALHQLLEQHLTLEVNDHGKTKVLKEKSLSKLIFPEEFKLLVEKQGDFEFLGFFKPFSFTKLEKENSFNYILLRRK